MIKFFYKTRHLFTNSAEQLIISKNILWLFVEKAVQFCFAFFVGVLVTRYLGVEQYGVYSYALALTGIVGAVASLGLGSVLVRELVKQPKEKEVLLGAAFFSTLTAAVLAQGICFLIIYILRPDDKGSIGLVLILSLPFFCRSLSGIEYYFESKVQSAQIVPVSMTVLVIGALLKLWFVFKSFPLVAFAWVMVFESLLYAAGLIWLYYRNVGDIMLWCFHKEKAKQLLKDGLPLMFSSLMIFIYMKIDQIMIREMVSDAEVGLYASAVRLTEVWYFFPMIITKSFFPKMMKAKTEDTALFYAQLQRLYNLIVMITYVIAIPISIFSKPIITFVYGESFSNAGTMLSLMIWTLLFVGLGTVRGTFLLSENRTRLYFLITLLSALMNVVLNWYLIPLYGARGAVIATLISYSFAAFFSCFFYKPLWQNGGMMLKALVWPKIF